MTAKYIPEVVIRDGQWAPVSGAIAYPPSMHPNGCPIREDMYAVQIQTHRGNRWYGGTGAYIDSTLRMVIEGYNGAESAGWEKKVAR